MHLSKSCYLIWQIQGTSGLSHPLLDPWTDMAKGTELSHSLLLTAGLRGNQNQHFSKMLTEYPHVSV